ncbi:hypothetical protein HYR99_06600 [Candidatus Poribacteria bacterium]|nr:hypothetical protein [Candidatus Poribacteria bacterium]
MKKHIFCLGGIVVITAVFWALAHYVEKDMVLYKTVVPPANVQLDQWLDNFERWAIVGIIMAGIASLLWYIFAQWVFKINHWGKSGKRGVWLLLLILPPVVAIILGFIFTQKAQAGAWPAYLFYILNGTLCYYLATALFSPSSFKYTPWGTSKFRRW